MSEVFEHIIHNWGNAGGLWNINGTQRTQRIQITMSNCFTHQTNTYVFFRVRITLVQSLVRQTHLYIS